MAYRGTLQYDLTHESGWNGAGRVMGGAFEVDLPAGDVGAAWDALLAAAARDQEACAAQGDGVYDVRVDYIARLYADDVLVREGGLRYGHYDPYEPDDDDDDDDGYLDDDESLLAYRCNED